MQDFKLSLKVKLTPNKENSGIQFRSVPLPDGEMRGPQADIGAGWWGKLYEESGRGLLAKEGGEKFVKPDEWNDYVVEAIGGHVKIWINGNLCTDYADDKLATRRRRLPDPQRRPDGGALQGHEAGGEVILLPRSQALPGNASREALPLRITARQSLATRVPRQSLGTRILRLCLDTLMTRSRYRFNHEAVPQFLTCSAIEWLPIFTRPDVVGIIYDSWRFLQQHGRITLLGYVIMENHLHLIATSSNLLQGDRGLQVIHSPADHRFASRTKGLDSRTARVVQGETQDRPSVPTVAGGIPPTAGPE